MHNWTGRDHGVFIENLHSHEQNLYINKINRYCPNNQLHIADRFILAVLLPNRNWTHDLGVQYTLLLEREECLTYSISITIS